MIVFCSFDNLWSVRGNELMLGGIIRCVYIVYAALMAALGEDQQGKSIQWMPLYTGKFLPVRQLRGDCREKQLSFFYSYQLQPEFNTF